MSRDSETDVRVYEGEVEHFVSAQSEGIGIRVIRDGRTGFAYAGTLDDDGDRRGARRGARQRRVRHDRRVGRPRRARRRRRRARRSCGTRRSPTFADRSQDRAGQGARAADAGDRLADPRRRRQLRRRRSSRRAVATTTGIRRSGRENGCYVSVSTLADDGDETQTGFGFSVGRSPRRVRSRQGSARGGRPGDPAARRRRSRRAGGRPSCSTRT